MSAAPSSAVPAGSPGPVTAADDVAVVVPAGIATPATIPADVFAEAIASYLSGERLDMQALARKLGVGRATLYRRSGSRERLLDEVVWWRSRHALVDAVRASAELRGPARVTAVVRHVLTAAERDVPLHRFLEADPRSALRILTGARSKAQHEMIGAVERLLELERSRGHLVLDDVPTTAFAVVRISETFLYADVIADRAPDIAGAVRIIEALLRGLGDP